jgi:penicillin-binding protein-related factor A (putative recombinase)
MSKNNGKPSEKEYLAHLKCIMEANHEFIYGRFTDSSDARNLVQPAPSDYYITWRSQPWLVEVKSSVDLIRFPLKNISGSQLGFAMRYIKAGWRSMFILHHLPTQSWYFVPFSIVMDKFKSPAASWKWEELAKYKYEIKFEFWRH